MYFGVRVFTKPSLERDMWENKVFAIQSPSTTSFLEVLLRTALEPPLLAAIRELTSSGTWHFLLPH